MKTLHPLQYEYLLAIDRCDVDTIITISIEIDAIGMAGQLLNRGLYTMDDDGSIYFDMDTVHTARLTPLGKTALMCYRALTTQQVF